MKNGVLEERTCGSDTHTHTYTTTLHTPDGQVALHRDLFKVREKDRQKETREKENGGKGESLVSFFFSFSLPFSFSFSHLLEEVRDVPERQTNAND